MPEQIIILVRHAHRDKTEGHSIDNGLSTKGKKQAKRLVSYLESKAGNKFTLISSPKKRCVETLMPLAMLHKLKIIISPLLLEQNKKENLVQFKSRIRKIIKSNAENNKNTLILCTHGDWIPNFLEDSIGAYIELKKAGVAILKNTSYGLVLEELIQRIG